MSYQKENDIPQKANRILNVVLFCLVLIAVRLWYLTVISHEEHVKIAERPKTRVLIEPARRASIRDRYNIPLAINKMRYQAAVIYGQIRSLAPNLWAIGVDGVKKKVKRSEYIGMLSRMLAKELNLDERRIEDLIHSKASLHNQIPYVIKTDLTESEYYRLKMLEKEWPGIEISIAPKRYYPLGSVGSDVIGYMGAISQDEYDRIVREIKELEILVSDHEQGLDPIVPVIYGSIEEARERLSDLKEKSYTIHDAVGKSGIEGRFDKELRGFFGKRIYEADARGTFLREKSGGREPIGGDRLLLSISSELQAFAEGLLIKNEMIRKPKLSDSKSPDEAKEPWIKGGAIVAMDPSTGEILALATHPRFDPNDFVTGSDPDVVNSRQQSMQRWFETENHIKDLWDQKTYFKRERFDLVRGFVEEEKILDLPAYLSLVLPAKSIVRKKLLNEIKIKEAYLLDSISKELAKIAKDLSFASIINYLYQENPHKLFGPKLGALGKIRIEESFEKNKKAVSEYKQELDKLFSGIDSNYDKVLLVDLARLFVNSDLFSRDLLKAQGEKPLSVFRLEGASLIKVLEHVRATAKTLFSETTFYEWREKEGKKFLKEKRLIEKETKHYPRPYLDYLDEQENALFEEFFGRHKWQLLTAFLLGRADFSYPEEGLVPYLTYFEKWHAEIMQGADRNAPWHDSFIILNKAAEKFELPIFLEYLQSMRSYKDLDRPLFGRLKSIKTKKLHLEKDLAASFYPKYGFGYTRSYAYRQSAAQGSIFKLITAYAALIQKYKALPGGKRNKNDLNPLEMVDQFYKKGTDEFVGYHTSGTPIPRYYKGGRLPRSISSNMGTLDMVKAIERSSNPYFALLAGDVLEEADDLIKAAYGFSLGQKTGIDLPYEIAGNLPRDISDDKTNLYSFSIGQGSLVVTPLQTAVMLSAMANGGSVLVPNIMHLSVGDCKRKGKEIFSTEGSIPFQDTLKSASIDYPLFTKALQARQKKEVRLAKRRVKRELFFPDEVKKVLFEGMYRVTERIHQFSTSGSLAAFFSNYPEAMKALHSVRGQLIGKTSTAETMEQIDLDFHEGVNKYNHLWFGGISFEEKAQGVLLQNQFGKPELVVVVYLRYGGYGRDTVPLAAQIVEKWRAIKKKHLASK